MEAEDKSNLFNESEATKMRKGMSVILLSVILLGGVACGTPEAAAPPGIEAPINEAPPDVPAADADTIVVPEGATVLYTLDKDAMLSLRGMESPALKQSGSPSITVVTAEDGTPALEVKNRVNNYDGVDVLKDALRVDGSHLPGTYTFVATGHTDPSARLVWGMTESPWGELSARTAPDADGRFTVTFTATYGTGAALGGLAYSFRLQSPPDNVKDFTIDNIVVYAQNMGAPDEADIAGYSFDDAAQEGLFTVADCSAIEWASGAGLGHDDDAFLKVTHIEGMSYTSGDNHVRLTFAEPLPPGAVYKVSAWFFAPAEENAGKAALTGPGIVLNGDYAGATGVSKFPLSPGTLPPGEWMEVSAVLPLQEKPLETLDFRLVVNDAPNHPDVWYLDDITISQIGGTIAMAVPEWDLSLDSLAQAYSDSFMLGNILEPGQTADADMTAMFKHHYNVLTAENAMKPMYLSKKRNEYSFAEADKLVAWARGNDIAVHGHTLVWHSQSADWLTHDDAGGILTRAEAKANMEAYINAVAGHYKGQLISWDVVNEAFMSNVDQSPNDWRDALRGEGGDGSPWFLAYANGAADGESGADYIYDAFVFARFADPGAVLYYNDFNETMPGKRDAIGMMVEALNEQWKGDPRNTDAARPLIEGVGMQSHYFTKDFNAGLVEAAVKRFAAAGVRVSISELDLPFDDYGTYQSRTTAPSDAERKEQAYQYGRLFDIYLKYTESIDRVTFWGKADPQSWRSEGYPLLFNKDFDANAAYYAIIEKAQ